MNKFAPRIAGDGISPDHYSREELAAALRVYSLRLRIAEAALAEERISKKAQSELFSKMLSQASFPSERGVKAIEDRGVAYSHSVGSGAKRKCQVLRNQLRQKFVWRRDIRLILGSELFDGTWYLEQNVDVSASGYDPVRHFILFGGVEGRDPSPSFSSKRYLVENVDVAKAKLNPLVHYLKYGRIEGRMIFSA